MRFSMSYFGLHWWDMPACVSSAFSNIFQNEFRRKLCCLTLLPMLCNNVSDIVLKMKHIIAIFHNGLRENEAAIS